MTISEEKGFKLEINYLKEVASTHKLLIEKLEQGVVKPPIAFSADTQIAGIGSRENSWVGYDGNLFLSFAQTLDDLPDDLPLSSISIYYSFLLKEVLQDLGSKVFLKWPNDFYIDDKKIGGTITKVVRGDTVICSIGLNLKKAPKNFEIIDIKIDKNSLLNSYFLKLKQDIFWKYIFRKYKIEFSKSRRYFYNDNMKNKKISLEEAVLQSDGSIILNDRKVYSLR